MKLKVGSIVLCPECKDEICDIVEELDIGTHIHAGHFKMRPGQELREGAEGRCNKCGVSWIISPNNALFIKGIGVVP